MLFQKYVYILALTLLFNHCLEAKANSSNQEPFEPEVLEQTHLSNTVVDPLPQAIALPETNHDSPLIIAEDSAIEMHKGDHKKLPQPSLYTSEAEELVSKDIGGQSDDSAEQPSQKQSQQFTDMDPALVGELFRLPDQPLYQGDRSLHNLKDNSKAQVTSVSSLSDISPSDWSYQAIQSLSEQYGCIAGYPNGTFKGNRSATRFEVAAVLNACLDQIGDRFASKADLDVVKALQDEFATELATLRGRVEDLENRVSTVESQQFSTTTILGGEAIFGLAGATGGEPPGLGQQRIIAAHLTRLQLVTSFTGKDILRVQLGASNFSDGAFANPSALNTNMALLSFQSDSANQLRLDSLEYRFAPFDRFVVTVKPVGFNLSSILTANSPYFDVGRGSISRFGEASPIFKIGNLDTGFGFDWLLSSRLRLQAAYGTRNGGTLNGIDSFGNTFRGGITGADHSAAGVQLLFNPTDTVLAGLAYINAYSSNGQLDTFTGSNNADTSGGFNEPSTIHAASLTFQWRATPNLTLGAWGGVTVTDSRVSDNIVGTFTYLGSIGYSDPFGREGDLIGALVGQPPKLFAGTVIPDEGTSIHAELFYRFKLSDNIYITPGFFIVTDPGHIPENNAIFVGTVRTTFRF